MRKYGLILVAALALIGWKSAPIETNLSLITENPDKFKDRSVQITAPIVENSTPQGHEYKTWSFVLGASTGQKLPVDREGFNPATIMKAYDLVEKARMAGEAVTVVGKLRETDSGLELQLASIRYGDTQINTNEGPFVQTVYEDDCYPGGPLFYDGHTYYPGNFPY